MAETIRPQEQSPRNVEIRFTPLDPSYEIHAASLRAIWRGEGSRAVQAFQDVTGLPFKENSITALVGPTKDGISHSGHNLSEPIQMSYRSSDPLGTLIHELTHRFIMQYDLWKKNRSQYQLTDSHQLLDLIYFEILKTLYGEKATLRRAQHESDNRDPRYKQSWDWLLAMTEAERVQMIREITDREKQTAA